MSLRDGLGRLLARLSPTHKVPIVRAADAEATAVDEYWSRHTVNSTPFETAEASEQYLQWRNEQYPLFPEFMDMWGSHPGQTVLDYGCGPGNDVTGFLLYSGAARVIGIDVSPKALDLARHRVELHRFAPTRVELIQTADDARVVPLPDAHVDYINCGGVLHHTSHPKDLLLEFNRVLAPSGSGCIMVYNRRSLWFHLYVAYVKMILEGAYPGLSVEEAFTRSTDGEDCPISIAYDPDEFVGLLQAAGFTAEFVGGYPSLWELRLWNEHGAAAIADPRLAVEHRAFLEEIRIDSDGHPVFRGKHAGIGGVYRFRKA